MREQREIKFRAWMQYWDSTNNNISHKMIDWDRVFNELDMADLSSVNYIFMQFTGLKDKNGLTDIYEDDIIGVDGIVRGNRYENGSLLQDKTNLIIPGITSKDWQAAYAEAMGRGCQHS